MALNAAQMQVTTNMPQLHIALCIAMHIKLYIRERLDKLIAKKKNCKNCDYILKKVFVKLDAIEQALLQLL